MKICILFTIIIIIILTINYYPNLLYIINQYNINYNILLSQLLIILLLFIITIYILLYLYNSNTKEFLGGININDNIGDINTFKKYYTV